MKVILVTVLLVGCFCLGIEAAQSFCRTDLQSIFCDIYKAQNPGASTGPSNYPGAPNYNASAVWLITNNDAWDVSPSATLRPPQWPLLGLPVIFLFGSAQLRMTGISASTAANIYVCDSAAMRVVNSTWRNEALFKFQYYVWLSGNSTGVFQNSLFNTVSPDAPQDQLSNVMIQARERSTLLIDNVSGYRAFGQDSMQIIVADSANATQRNTYILEESYIAGVASTRFINVSYTDLFFEVCPSNPTLILEGLPALCDINAGECLVPAQPTVSYELKPPTAPYTVSITDSRVFSWAASTYSNSSCIIRNNPAKANIAVGMGGLYTSTAGDNVVVSVSTGANSGFKGIANRQITVENTQIIAWHIWPNTDLGDGTPVIADYTVTVASGSSIGDVLVGGNIAVVVEESMMSEGQMNSQNGNNPIYIVGGEVTYQVRSMAGGYISFSEGVAFSDGASLIVDNTAYVFAYDNALPASTTVYTGGLTYTMWVTQPALGVETDIRQLSNLTVIGNTSVVGGGSTSATITIYELDADDTATTQLYSQPFASPHTIDLRSTIGSRQGSFRLAVKFVDDSGSLSVGSVRKLTNQAEHSGASCLSSAFLF